jgi:Protein of unknown function (DUF1256).
MGDSVGPTVGELLIKKYNLQCFVYGTGDHSVNGKNLGEYVEHVKSVHSGAPVIAVDACLSDVEKVGTVKVLGGGVNPRRALTGRKNPVGDVGVLGVVGDSSDGALCSLLSVHGVNTLKLCDKIAFVLYFALCSA